MEIRLAHSEDYEPLGELTVDAYQAVHTPEDMAGYAAELRDVAGRAVDADVLVAIDGDGTVLGGVTYVPGPDSSSAEFTELDGAGIRMLAVSPDAQRRGVGESLVRACIERACAAGRAQILLHSTDTMTTAHRLYLRLGFERDPSIDWSPLPDLQLLGFCLKL
jgi:ribosomal protein S18 acetylase RimI-like enzyme